MTYKNYIKILLDFQETDKDSTKLEINEKKNFDLCNFCEIIKLFLLYNYN